MTHCQAYGIGLNALQKALMWSLLC